MIKGRITKRPHAEEFSPFDKSWPFEEITRNRARRPCSLNPIPEAPSRVHFLSPSSSYMRTSTSALPRGPLRCTKLVLNLNAYIMLAVPRLKAFSFFPSSCLPTSSPWCTDFSSNFKAGLLRRLPLGLDRKNDGMGYAMLSCTESSR
jgi:hypothetical protein